MLSHANIGLIGTLNGAIPVARGEFIARMDSDDISLPNRIERQLAEFRRKPDLMLCGSDHHLICEDGRILDPWGPRGRLSDREIAIQSMFFAPFSHPSAMFRRSVFQEGIGYDPGYPHAEDFDIFRRVAARFRVHKIPERLVAIKRFGDSIMTRHYWPMRATHYRIVDECLMEFGVGMDFRPLHRLAGGEHGGPDEVEAAARCLRDVRAHAATLDSEAAATFLAGYQNLFSHALETIAARLGEQSARRFAVLVGEWDRLRRREKLIFSLPRQLAGVVRAFGDRLDASRNSRNSQLLSSSYPTSPTNEPWQMLMIHFEAPARF